MRTTPRAGGSYSFVRTIFEQVDDRKLVAALESPYTTGRPPSYPVRALLRAFLTKYVLSIQFNLDLVERLQTDRNLRQACGFDHQAPSSPTLSRFFKRLLAHQDLVEKCVSDVTSRMRRYLPNLGQTVAIDGTDVESWAHPDRGADQDARWGVRHCIRPSGKEVMETYFGFKLHALVCADSGVPLSFILTPANVNDGTMFVSVVDKAMGELPWLEPKYILGDRGYDYRKNYPAAVDRGITPVINIRNSKPKGSSMVYEPVAGAPVCLGGKAMKYVRTDPETGHHLFRCPAKGCKLKAEGTKAIKHCDDQVWENPADNLRIVGIIARQSKEWDRQYDKRQSVERWFNSAKHSRLLDTHRQLSMARVRLHATLSVLAWQATAIARLQAENRIQTKLTGRVGFRQMRVSARMVVRQKVAA